MNDFDLSIIVVNFNAGSMLSACLRAATTSTLSVQCIVVDNASTDDSLDQLLKTELHNRIEVIRNPENFGFSRAVNIGAAQAHASVLLLLNPDCIVYPGAFEALLDTLEQESGSGLVGGLVTNMDGSEQRGCRRSEPSPSRIAKRMLTAGISLLGIGNNGIDQTTMPMPENPVKVDAVSGAFLMIRKSVFDDLGGMDEGYFLHFEDLDICRRVRDSGHQVIFQPKALAIHYKSASGGVGKLNVERHKHDGLLRYLDKFYPAELFPGARLLMRFMTRGHLGYLTLVDWLHSLRCIPDAIDSSDDRNVIAMAERLIGQNNTPWIVLTGATSQVGDYLVPRLVNAPYRVFAITRGDRAGCVKNNIWWVKPEFLDFLAKAGTSHVAAWVHLAPIWVVSEYAAVIQRLKPRRIIAVSSSSVETKRESTGQREKSTVDALVNGEAVVRALGQSVGAQETLFRPSMIYGNQNNKNISLLTKWITWFRVFPLVGSGQGKRQPVHADDIAASCLAVLDNSDTFGKIYVLAGKEVLEFKDMIRRIYASVAQRPMFVSLPRRTLRGALAILSHLPGLGFLTPEMINRMNQDLKFDISPAQQDFGYSPRDFRL